MEHIDCGFPIITYKKEWTPYECGLHHGKSFSKAISILAQTRKNLMLSKSPHLEGKLDQLAIEQFQITKDHMPDMAREIEGIVDGSGLTLADIVIVNNYTDFRDINLADEGCSTISFANDKGVILGQTWDMHSSAKNYLCLIHIEGNDDRPEQMIYSLVGCLGIMGASVAPNMIGVNNINTTDARPGVIWPALVREVTKQAGLEKMKSRLVQLPVTGAHNYMMGDPSGHAHIEHAPTKTSILHDSLREDKAVYFHCNHCLSDELISIEDKNSISSTTHARTEILNRRVGELKDHQDLLELFASHEGYPKSICSHFVSGAQDPAMTCGGGTADFQGNEMVFWRGCEKEDQNFVRYRFKISNSKFTKS